MTLEAITFDLWGTVLWPRDPDGKFERRMALLAGVVAEAGVRVTPAALREAWHAAFADADALIRQDCVDVGPAGRWRLLARRIGLPEDAVPYSQVEAIYQDLTLEFPPPLMPGIEAVLAAVAGRYRVGLICNTGVTGGAVLRQVLGRYGLLDCFDATVFSNEFGRVKPHPAIFHHTLGLLGDIHPARAVHVGDMEDLDVDGARGAGLRSLRYVFPELQPPPVASRSDGVFHDWADFLPLLDDLGGAAAPGADPSARP